jgi:hypothetical protein
MDTVEQEELSTANCFDSSRTASLRNRGFIADDFIHLKHGSDIDLLVAIPAAPVHANDISGGPDEDFGAAGDFGGKSDREIQLAASVDIVIDGEIDAPRGNVSGLTGPGDCLFFKGHSNDYRQRQIKSSYCAAVLHSDGWLRLPMPIARLAPTVSFVVPRP